MTVADTAQADTLRFCRTRFRIWPWGRDRLLRPTGLPGAVVKLGDPFYHEARWLVCRAGFSWGAGLG